MDQTTREAMRKLGWTWSASGQHFHRSVREKRSHRLIGLWKDQWKAECYGWDFAVDQEWCADVTFDTPFAALAHAEVEQWGAQ